MALNNRPRSVQREMPKKQLSEVHEMTEDTEKDAHVPVVQVIDELQGQGVQGG